MSREDARRGALEAVERIVNRGAGDVAGEVAAVLSPLYGGAVERDARTVRVLDPPAQDESFLRRAATLVSAHARLVWSTEDCGLPGRVLVVPAPQSSSEPPPLDSL